MSANSLLSSPRFPLPLFSVSLLYLISIFPALLSAEHRTSISKFTESRLSVMHGDEGTPGLSALVKVRTIQATGGKFANGSEEPIVDERLMDIREKLLKLHFKNYKMLASQSQVVPVMKRGYLSLLNGYNLMVRPLVVSSERMSVWLNWKDPQGVELLDTRMHFDPGESMLTGTEFTSIGTSGLKSGEQSGVILAIEVRPAE